MRQAARPPTPAPTATPEPTATPSPTPATAPSPTLEPTALPPLELTATTAPTAAGLDGPPEVFWTAPVGEATSTAALVEGTVYSNILDRSVVALDS